jgi:hypothetical protein
MLIIKKVTLITAAILLSLSSLAQSVKVKKETSRIKGENTEGYALNLEGNVSDVTASLIKYFKSIGKVKQADGIIMLTESLSVGSNTKYPVYGVVREKGTEAEAWIGILPSEWPADQGSKLDKELEKMLHEFGVKFYKDKIQLQIDETTQALVAVEKQQQRLVTENKNLNTKLENNKKEKLRLEQSIENNKLDYETILKNIEKNKHAQDSVALAGEQIKKVMEQQKEKQGKIN